MKATALLPNLRPGFTNAFHRRAAIFSRNRNSNFPSSEKCRADKTRESFKTSRSPLRKKFSGQQNERVRFSARRDAIPSCGNLPDAAADVARSTHAATHNRSRSAEYSFPEPNKSVIPSLIASPARTRQEPWLRRASPYQGNHDRSVLVGRDSVEPDE